MTSPSAERVFQGLDPFHRSAIVGRKSLADAGEVNKLTGVCPGVWSKRLSVAHHSRTFRPQSRRHGLRVN